MSVVNVQHKSHEAHQRDLERELPVSIREKIHFVIRQDRRAVLVHRIALALGVGLLAIISLIVADVLCGIRSTQARWAIWLSGLSVMAGVIRYRLNKPSRDSELLIDAAWKIESSHPALEERLTSTVQFLNDRSHLIDSPQLIQALVSETSSSVDRIDTEAVPTQSSRLSVTVATLLATALIASAAIWPQTVLTSLDNLATPWSPYVLPVLSADIVPGDVTIVEGESIEIQVKGTDDLVRPTLEINHGDVLTSHTMAMNSPNMSSFTLTDVRRDTGYRIHSGGLYSLPHTITVQPRPQLMATAAYLRFPAYTQLDPLTIENCNQPIEVPAGTEVTLTATSNLVANEGVIQWDAKPQKSVARKLPITESNGLVTFEWTLKADPKIGLVGAIELRSEQGVPSLPHPVEIRGLSDTAPTIEITSPTLRQLTMRRADNLPIRYRVTDDFGISSVELMGRYGRQDPVTLTCPEPDAQSGEQRVWVGATSLRLPEAPADCQELSVWLRIADNRPDQFGGPQVIESEAIHITLDDRAESLGEQQILADRQWIENSLEKAIEQMRTALAAAEALQQEQGDSQGAVRGTEKDQLPPAEGLGGNVDHQSTRNDHIDALRQNTSSAKQTLDQVARGIRDRSSLFESKAEEIQKVADREVAEALELANQIPLMDDDAQQAALAQDSGRHLVSAMDQLENLHSSVKQKAEQMEQAAQLDQLATQQERLADEAAEREKLDVPEQAWRDRQAEVAKDLQNLAKENEDRLGVDAKQPQLDRADREKLLERADQAEQLAEQAQRLAQQQQQLEKVMREAQEDGANRKEVKQQLQELIELQKDDIDQLAERNSKPQDDKVTPAEERAVEKQQQHMDEAAKAAQVGELNQAAAKIQEQIARRAEQMKQTAEQLTKQDNPDPAIQASAKQAGEQMQRAQQKAEQASQSLCKKCNGGEQNKSDGQDMPVGQSKFEGNNKTDARNGATGQEQAAGHENKNRQQPQGAAQAKGGEQEKQTPAQDDANIRRDQQDAAQSLQQASQSLNQVCEACRECANGSGPGSGESNSSSPNNNGSTKRGSLPSSKPLASVSDAAKQAARSPSNEKAVQHAQSVAEQLNQLADEAANESGYSLRQPKDSSKDPGTGQGTSDRPESDPRGAQLGKPAGDPRGVGNAAAEPNFQGKHLRGDSNSNWTRSRRKLDGGVLDDRDSRVPEQYRAVVRRYFEELSRQQSNWGE